MKLIISESEKQRILGMHNKVRNLLFETIATDKPNWNEAETWVAGQPNAELGEWPTSDPEYKYAKYKNYQGNWMEIQNNGNAMEHKGDGTPPVHTGTWSWNGSKVVFSWMKSEASNWEAAKQHFIDTNAADWNTGWTYDTQGIWNDYEWVRVKLDSNNNTTLEIKSDGTYKMKYFEENDTIRAGKWSWDGSKIIFNTKAGMTKRASGYFTEDDGGSDSREALISAVFEKNKIGNIGAKGPAVKFIQKHVTPYNPNNPDENLGTGAGCGSTEDKCDGNYGPKTKELVKKWQKENGVTPDGIFGKESARMLLYNNTDAQDKID